MSRMRIEVPSLSWTPERVVGTAHQPGRIGVHVQVPSRRVWLPNARITVQAD
jgi:hypothetical protein